MRIALFATLFVVLLALKPAQVKKNIIFFGDSITEQGAKPGGYILLADSMCNAEGQKDNFSFTGSGVGGNKVYDLYLRMETDVLDKKPDVVVIYIGINDVWHKTLIGTGTDADKFEKFYQAIINKLEEKNIGVVVCTPSVIGEKTDNTNRNDGDLNEYTKIIKNLAAKNTLPLVDLRKLFLNYNLEHNPDNKTKGVLTTDGVHLNNTGNLLVAKAMWAIIKENYPATIK